MNKLLPLAKQSAKEVFFKLRKNWPYFCNAISSEILIWKSFFNHVAFNKNKNRKIRELLERLLIIPFIKKIIENWELTEKRDWEKSEEYYKISLNNWNNTFSIIIIKNKSYYFLLSCFIDFK